MSNYVPGSLVSSSKNSRCVSSEITSLENLQNKRIRSAKFQDTLEACPKNRDDSFRKGSGLESPALPAPQKSGNQQYLMIVAKAFADAFNSMDQGIIQGTKNYAKLQAFNETCSKAVLESTVNVIHKEEHQAKLTKEITEYQKKVAKTDKVMFIVSIVVSAAMFLATVGSMVFTAGATAALLPEEMELEMTEMGATAAPEIQSSTSSIESGAEDIGSSADQSGSSEETGNVEEPEISIQKDSVSNEEAQNIAKQTEKTVEKSESKLSTENTKSADATSRTQKILESRSGKVLKFMGKQSMKAGLGAVLGMPTLIEGIFSLSLHGKYKDLANAQGSTGTAMAQMQDINMIAQFYQQLTQRLGNTLQSETSGAGDVVSTYSDIVNAYRQITYGLASVV